MTCDPAADRPVPNGSAEVVADTSATSPRAVILRGGDPSDEQAAALAAALLSVGGATTSPSPWMSGWQRAALAEGVGTRRHSERRRSLLNHAGSYLEV